MALSRSFRFFLYSALLSPCLTRPAIAQDQSDISNDQIRLEKLIEAVPLPDAFYIESHFYINGEENPSQGYKNWIGPTWSVALQSVSQPGLGFIPLSYTYGTQSDTWRYYFDRKMAERSDTFSDRLFISSEATNSPAYVLRAIGGNRSTIDHIESDSENGVTIVTLSTPSLFRKANIIFDSNRGYLTRIELLGPDGKQLGEGTRYEDWRELSSGYAIPYKIIATNKFGPDLINMASVIVDAEIIDAQTPPKRLEISSDFTIIDQIEGVTKTADGKVIGPIQRGKPTTNANAVRTGPPGTTGLKPRLVMLIGVGLILLAGVILGLRRWKGA